MWDKNAAISPNLFPCKKLLSCKHKSAFNSLSILCTFASLPAGAHHQPSSCKGCFMKKLDYNNIMGIFYQFRRQHEHMIKTLKKIHVTYEKKTSNCWIPILKY